MGICISTPQPHMYLHKHSMVPGGEKGTMDFKVFGPGQGWIFGAMMLCISLGGQILEGGCVCERERERERVSACAFVCVCVCVCELCISLGGQILEDVCVCVCVCVLACV